MAATQQDINNYITSIRDAFSILANKAAKKEIIGHTDVFCPRQKVTIVGDYLEEEQKKNLRNQGAWKNQGKNLEMSNIFCIFAP